MESKVYFIDMGATIQENFMEKLARLMFVSGISSMISETDIVAIKLHFGEKGNAAFIRPVYVRKIVEVVKQLGASPFLTDTNTLYSGTRSDAPTHLVTAIQNGFATSVVGAPLIIADGLRGKSHTLTKINRSQFDSVYIAKEIAEADVLLSVAHFKGHELTGFGGTIKNLGMGCASRRGKLAQHSSLTPKIVAKKCTNCKECAKHCSQNAIKTIKGKSQIENEKCIGCSECIVVCPNNAVKIRWNQSVSLFMQKMVEYTEGTLLSKRNKSLFLNFITDVSPACDCLPSNDAPIVKNIGVLCSKNPVAIDQAAVDLVNKEAVLSGTVLNENLISGDDKFKELYPKVNWEIQLEYAQTLGLGNRTYELIKL